MLTRSKLVAAAIALAVSAGAVGDVSAATLSKTMKTRTVATKAMTTKIVRSSHRIHAAAPVVRHVRVVHRAPVVATSVLGARKIVRVTKRPLLQKVASVHRLVAKKTVIR